MPPTAAVCLTGLERSFAEIGLNVREGLFTLLNSSRTVSFFGVRPINDEWKEIPALLPLHGIAVQQPCWSAAAQNNTIAWMHCDMRLRKGDCRLAFLQALCDMEACERLISENERSLGRRFDLVVRLRADLFWEARVSMPPQLAPNTIYVPAMDTPGGDIGFPGTGINDHLAYGERGAMAKYLTRMRHISREGIRKSLDKGGSEQYLAHSLRWDDIRVKRLQEWMYCPHTPRNLLRRAQHAGCISRVRCRTSCHSLFCPHAAAKADQCECLDTSCATFAAHNSSGDHLGRAAVIGPGWTGRMSDQTRQHRFFRNPSKRDVMWPVWCVDMLRDDGTQGVRGHRASPLQGRLQLFHALRRPCVWRNITAGTVHVMPSTAAGETEEGLRRFAVSYFSSRPEGVDPSILPRCFFPSAEVEPHLTSRERKCKAEVHASAFVSGRGRFPTVSAEVPQNGRTGSGR